MRWSTKILYGDNENDDDDDGNYDYLITKIITIQAMSRIMIKNHRHLAKHSAGVVEAELSLSEPICIMTTMMMMMMIIMIIIRSQHDEYVKADQRKLQQKSMLIRGNWRKIMLIRGNCQKNADHRWAGENWSKMR